VILIPASLPPPVLVPVLTAGGTLFGPIPPTLLACADEVDRVATRLIEWRFLLRRIR
jgi:hypothetical protein